jgi:acyl transferase domain-containing protein/Zn-dependent alcohol dehydrogenase
MDENSCGAGVAIIGMVGRFPGAKNVEEFWTNLRDGVESLSSFSDEELAASGVDTEMMRNPSYVRARPILGGAEWFDARFFGFSPREAEVLDPQQRLFLECAWEALEVAGYAGNVGQCRVGVYAGSTISTYMLQNLYNNREVRAALGLLQILTGNDKDYLSTRVSYKLGLTGPSISVNTACSTSLVAVCLAAQALADGACDVALAGGVNITVPEKQGYLYQRGGILSPDGHCRAFDRRAQGTTFGDGVGIVVLKRLGDALADGDSIDGVILASAINNDGAAKVGFTAPSPSGQADVIEQALGKAGIDPETITYVEAHGTGTPLGDPVEIAGLTRAFRRYTSARSFCSLGSVKTNVGHLHTAAGIAGLVKTLLALRHRQIPPTLHFEEANPEIDFASTPFQVSRTLSSWEGPTPLRAAVSSFGIGGTNAHVILEEAPPRPATIRSATWQVVPLSAKTESALAAATINLVRHLERHPELELADVAFTLQRGREAFAHRRAVVAKTVGDAVTALEDRDPQRVFTTVAPETSPSVAFMFPGQGAQYTGMGEALYREESSFRAVVDQCAGMLALPHDLRDVLYPRKREAEAEGLLGETAYAQPGLFVIEYALAQLMLRWGIKPDVMIGHSIGEYVAACLLGVFTLENALGLVAARGRLMQALPRGAMLAVALPEAEVRGILTPDIDLAAVNGAALCVVAGPLSVIDAVDHRLRARQVATRRVQTSHAFHSAMMEPILDQFRKAVQRANPRPPSAPYVSTVSGTWITAEQAIDPEHWTRQLRESVQFHAGLQDLLREPKRLLVEVGPGDGLTRLANQHPDRRSGQPVVSTLPPARQHQETRPYLLGAVGRLWGSGISVNWAELHEGTTRRRVPLPTYPFERRRYWIDRPRAASVSAPVKPEAVAGESGSERWLYAPTWIERQPSVVDGTGHLPEVPTWLVFVDDAGVGRALVERLRFAGANPLSVVPGERFAERADGNYVVNPECATDYDALLSSLVDRGKRPSRICHLWSLGIGGRGPAWKEGTRAFASLVDLARALGRHPGTASTMIDVVTDRAHAAGGEDELHPEQALVLGPSLVIPQEYASVRCRNVDVCLSEPRESVSAALFEELSTEATDEIVALRDSRRLIRSWTPIPAGLGREPAGRVREGGVYLITGGLGGIGLTLAEHLARTVRAKLVLTSRSGLPSRPAWEEWEGTHADDDMTTDRIRRVRGLETLGADVLVLAADVADEREMGAVFAAARERFGTIHGVIHAAGVPDGGVIQRRTAAMDRDVLAPKVQGTLVLWKLLENCQADFLVLCSSLAAVVAPAGQVAYCSANAFLDAFATAAARRGGPFTVAIAWDAWKEVGMAARAMLALSAGIAGTDGGREATVDGGKLIGRRLSGTGEEYVYATRLSPRTHWLLDEHRLLGKAVFPGTGYLEMAREAFAAVNGDGPVALHDVYFQRPLLVDDDQEVEVRTVLRQCDRGMDFSVESRDGTTTMVHAIGRIERIKRWTPRRLDLRALRADCGHELKLSAKWRAAPSRFVSFGPRWRSWTQVRVRPGRSLARFELPKSFRGDVGRGGWHPALLDSAIAILGLLEKECDGRDPYIPFAYKTVRSAGPLPARIWSHVRARGSRGAKARIKTYEVTIADERGRVIVEIEGLVVRRLEGVRAGVTQSTAAGASRAGVKAPNFALDLTSPGRLETLRFRSALRPVPGRDEVLINVEATGLNFRDVLMAIGGLPAAGGGVRLGYECSGRVAATGPGVKDFRRGDDVLALGFGCFTRFVTTPAALVRKRPRSVDAVQGATVPMAFLTAYYTLVTMARLARDERVLIHAAAGGVGLAAVKIARWIGAEVIATAGNEEKRAFLRSLGIQHVFDSRSLLFADRVMDCTDRRGVDVVLNSLGGEFIEKSLSILAPYGRFVEIGVRDVLLDRPLRLGVFERGLSFSTFMLRPDLPELAAAWTEVLKLMGAGALSPLPVTVFPASRVADAFQLMAGARHIGKIVVSLEDVAAAAGQHATSRAGSVDSGPALSGESGRNALAARPLDVGLSRAQGVEVFSRVLAGALPLVVVSLRDPSVAKSGMRGLALHTRSEAGFASGIKHPRPELGSPYLAPRDDLERTLAEIWGELLGIENVGVHDNFFALGGHSLLAIQVMSRLQASYPVDLSIEAIFEQPTVANIAAQINAARTEELAQTR